MDARPHIAVVEDEAVQRQMLADYLARQYFRVTGLADGAALQDATREAVSPGEVTPLLLDVTDQAQIAAAAQTVADHVGAAGLAGLVNNAGIGGFSPLELHRVIQGDRRRLEVLARRGEVVRSHIGLCQGEACRHELWGRRFPGEQRINLGELALLDLIDHLLPLLFGEVPPRAGDRVEHRGTVKVV